ncbi:MAG: hypothetical protein A2V66_18365 [Ignavibacteria bacterium RBG_13_36_8]|nr:MAG: hypothetical protein A2V66_18365 [Ignavibacteria bacterium RBG_13_36_8]
MRTILKKKFSIKSLLANYDSYKETSLLNRRFKHKEIIPLIKKLQEHSMFTIAKAGESLEGREIFLVSTGKGKTKILLWSQMHGDESTATMAMFDIFNFFLADDNFNNLRKEILEKTTLFFIPMLNPDGAEKFKRQNASEIDINRDAKKLLFPESQILESVYRKIKPKFAFNLHDQNSNYTVGITGKPAVLSFLAPPFDYYNSLNNARKLSIQVIIDIYNKVSKIIPNQIARYNDEYEPRAFGDNFVKRGTSSILIESGGKRDELTKQEIRKLNFATLLIGFHSIASNSYRNLAIIKYKEILENKELMFDVLLKNITIETNGKEYKIDIGINYEEYSTEDYESSFYVGKIKDIGDLSIYGAYDTFDCTDMYLNQGKTYQKKFKSFEKIKKLDFKKLYSDGFVSVILNSEWINEKYTSLPINILRNEKSVCYEISVENNANFVLINNNKVEQVVINGFVHSLKSKNNSILNGAIFN